MFTGLLLLKLPGDLVYEFSRYTCEPATIVCVNKVCLSHIHQKQIIRKNACGYDDEYPKCQNLPSIAAYMQGR